MNEWDFRGARLRSLSSAEIARFWRGYVEDRKPGEIRYGSLYSRWRNVDQQTVISLYLTNRSVGLFVRGQRGEGLKTTAARLATYEPALSQALKAPLAGPENCNYLTQLPIATIDENTWPEAYRWLEAAEKRYVAILSRTVSRPAE